MTIAPGKKSIIRTIKSWVKVNDPSNLDSDLRPSDLFDQESDKPAKWERDAVNLGEKRFKLSSNQRRIHEREWLVNMAMERGNQWVEYKIGTGTLESLIDPNDPYRSYIWSNQIAPIMLKLKARATQSKPDASVKPKTSAQKDVQATAEARDALAHYDSFFERQVQLLQWMSPTLICGLGFLKIGFNPDTEVLAPTLNGKGQFVNEKLPVGELEEYVVPPFEIYPDNNAREWSECEWLIHAKVRPLSWVQERFGKRGRMVQPEPARSGGNWNYAESRMDQITGDIAQYGGTSTNDTCTVYECWELPSDRYRLGRLFIWASGILLWYTDWPYTKNDTFPFIPLAAKKEFHGIWPTAMVSSLVPLQRAYNNTLSRIGDRVNTDKPTIIDPIGSEISIDAFQSRRSFQRVKHQKGFEPQYIQPPPIDEYWFKYLDILKRDMQDISGVHEISNGSVPAGVTAGNAIELLQQSDQTQMSEQITLIELAQKVRAEWEIALIAQFFKEPRLIAISDNPDPQGAMTAARSFEALTSGGNVSIEIVPGSATPKTPAAQAQQILDLFKAGAFQPQALPVTVAVWELLGLQRSDELAPEIEALAKQLMQQQDPQAQAAAQAQLQQQAAQQQQQHLAEMQAATDHNAELQAKFKAQNDAQLAQQKLDHDAHVLAINHEFEQQAAEREHQYQVQMKQLENQLAIELEHAKRTMPPSVTLAAKADPVATVDIEKAAGYDGEVPPIPKPAAPGSKPLGGGTK